MQNLILVKDVLKLVHPVLEKDRTAYYQKYRCPVRWLEPFTQCYFITNFEFIRKLDEAFRPIFEVYVGKKLDWQNIEICIVPYDSDFNMFRDPKNNNYIYVLTCNIGNRNMGIVNGDIIWYINIPEMEVDFFSNEFKHDINVIWVPEKKYAQETLNLFPNHIEKISKLKFKLKLKFPVFSWLDSMPHEGKFAITMEDINDKENVSEILGYGLGKWNTQTDQARETGDATLERGYCHTITFDGVEDNIAYWYIDAGSAHDGIHEFLLKGLSDSGIKIKSVEIQML